MSTKQEVKNLLAEMRDSHHEAKEKVSSEPEKRYHITSAAALHHAFVRVSEEIEE